MSEGGSEGLDRLRLDEGVDLAHAIVAEAATHVGARVLFIKGRAYGPHGLRPARSQADVDALVEPGRFEALLDQLRGWGWYIRLGEFSDFPLPHHSVTMIHDQWPCDLDVHHRFPGFLGEPTAVFEVLWRRRQSMSIAGVEVPVPDLPSSVLIMALHSVRSTPDNPRHASELTRLIGLSVGWGPELRADLARLAALTRCAQALGEVLPLLGVEVLDDGELDPAMLAHWRHRVTGRETASMAWVERLSSAPLRLKVRVVREALWPPEAFMRATRQIGESRMALNRARVARLAKGFSRLPREIPQHLGRRGRNVLDDARG